MSELVSANTKNFLFLTVSQYNEQKKLVPARVSMRRDQPFWEGGNSFIACESFRISSSPSEGGLYYGKIPSSWYLQTSMHQRSEPDDVKEDWPVQEQAVQIMGQTDTLKARNLYHTTVPGSSAAHPEYKCTMRLGLAPLARSVNDTRSLLWRMARYFNPDRITQGSYLRVQDGADDSKWVQGIVHTAPSVTLTGVGLGEHRLWQPECTIVTDVPTLAAQIHDDNDGVFEITVQFNDTSSTLTDLAARVEEFVSQGMYLEAFKKPAVGFPQCFQDLTGGNGAMFQVLAPTGTTVALAGAMTAGQVQGTLQWDAALPLTPGTLCTYNPRVPGTSTVTACTAAPYWLQPLTNHRVHAKLRVVATPSFLTWLSTRTAPAIIIALNSFMQPTTTAYPSVAGVGADVELYITATSAGAGQPPPTFTDSYSSVVKLGNGTKPEKRVIRRQPTTKDELYVYTPNDLFFHFNQADAQFLYLPWKLQTDENGGFQIEWGAAEEDPHAADYFDFTISKAMCDSLGLNNYMTAEVTRPTNNIDVGEDAPVATSIEVNYDVVVERMAGDVAAVATRTALTNFSASMHSVDARLLTNVDGSQFVPISPVTAVEMLRKVYLATGPDTHVLCQVLSCEAVESVVRKTEIVKYYPVIERDEYGATRYRYQNLPKKAKLGNTQQVSVESWSTYSQIDLVIPNLPFQPMLGSATDARILCSLRLPFVNETSNSISGQVGATQFEYYGDLLFNSDSSRSYLRITTDQQLYDVDVECRLIRRDGEMDILKLPYKGQFQVKLRFLQTQ